MKITSPAFQEGGTILEKFSKNGQNVNPELRIEGAPAEAKRMRQMMHRISYFSRVSRSRLALCSPSQPSLGSGEARYKVWNGLTSKLTGCGSGAA